MVAVADFSRLIALGYDPSRSVTIEDGGLGEIWVAQAIFAIPTNTGQDDLNREAAVA
jgi:hypothetical protein